MGASTPFMLYGIRNWAFSHVLAVRAAVCWASTSQNCAFAGLNLGEKSVSWRVKRATCPPSCEAGRRTGISGRWVGGHAHGHSDSTPSWEVTQGES